MQLAARLFWLLAATSCLCAPLAAADPSEGTEAEPELSDPPGNVSYHPAYTGAHDRGEVDLLAAWFSYDPAADAVTIHLKLADFAGFTEKTRDWWTIDSVISKLQDGDRDEAQLTADWTSNYTGSGLGPPEPSLRICKTPDSCVTPKFEFQAAFTTPGYLNWTLARVTLVGFAPSIKLDNAIASEQYAPVRAFPTTIQNSNLAYDGGVYDLSALRPDGNRTRAPDDPEFPSDPDWTPSTSMDDATKTSAIGAVAVLGLLGMAAVLRRRS